MTTIRERILARSDLASALEQRDLDALVAGLNSEQLTEVRECWVDALGLINRCSLGKSILRKLRSGAALDAVVEVAWRALVGGKGLDFGAESTRASIEEMAAAIGFTPEEVDQMMSIPLQPVVVTREEVEKAMFTE